MQFHIYRPILPHNQPFLGNDNLQGFLWLWNGRNCHRWICFMNVFFRQDVLPEKKNCQFCRKCTTEKAFLQIQASLSNIVFYSVLLELKTGEANTTTWISESDSTPLQPFSPQRLAEKCSSAVWLGSLWGTQHPGVETLGNVWVLSVLCEIMREGTMYCITCTAHGCGFGSSVPFS